MSSAEYRHDFSGRSAAHFRRALAETMQLLPESPAFIVAIDDGQGAIKVGIAVTPGTDLTAFLRAALDAVETDVARVLAPYEGLRE